MILSALLLSACLHLTRGRSVLEMDMDNEINVNPHNDWVKINQTPKRHITKNHGQRLELECEAMGSPPPTIQWYKEDRLLTVPVNIDRYENNIVNAVSSQGLASVKSRLVLNYLLPVHDGTFRCLAESGSEKAVAESRVYVINKDDIQMNFTTLVQKNILGAHHKPRVTLWSPTYMDVIGREILLPCQGVGNPRPQIQWVGPMGLIGEGEGRISMLSNGELRIRSVTWSDMGGYICIAKNHLGEDSAETFLYPMQES
ncbi:neural/ectodermal development factor IMP-L2 isoform X2 [Coccinella septempunctata]|nr:neural/ectodermal development factor IMP-L2 isoform X2 [Coccinella septempunctata]